VGKGNPGGKERYPLIHGCRAVAARVPTSRMDAARPRRLTPSNTAGSAEQSLTTMSENVNARPTSV
jgi:hypothetical protein